MIYDLTEIKQRTRLLPGLEATKTRKTYPEEVPYELTPEKWLSSPSKDREDGGICAKTKSRDTKRHMHFRNFRKFLCGWSLGYMEKRMRKLIYVNRTWEIQEFGD